MKTAKYITVKKDGFECAILIQPPLNHNECIAINKLADNCEILSAGYFSISSDTSVIVCLDMPSTTLGLKPRHGDAELIARSLWLMGLLLNFPTSASVSAIPSPQDKPESSLGFATEITGHNSAGAVEKPAPASLLQ